MHFFKKNIIIKNVFWIIFFVIERYRMVVLFWRVLKGRDVSEKKFEEGCTGE